MASILVQLIFADVTPEFMTSLIGLMIGGTIIVAIGIIDDYCDLPAKVKLLGQIFAAAVLVIGFDVRIDVIDRSVRWTTSTSSSLRFPRRFSGSWG